jgi:hypothetical protein
MPIIQDVKLLRFSVGYLKIFYKIQLISKEATNPESLKMFSDLVKSAVNSFNGTTVEEDSMEDHKKQDSHLTKITQWLSST